jgi:hypothetical protein
MMLWTPETAVDTVRAVGRCLRGRRQVLRNALCPKLDSGALRIRGEAVLDLSVKTQGHAFIS